MKTVTLYTDGACSGNPGPGGASTILRYGNRQREISEGFRWTTNNRMELMALILGLEALKEACVVEIHSDSTYVLDAFRKGWLRNWKRNGWKTAAKKPVQNQDLWRRLDAALERHTPKFHWVKGHAESEENNRCDALAVEASKKAANRVDEGYEAEVPYPGEDPGS